MTNISFSLNLYWMKKHTKIINSGKVNVNFSQEKLAIFEFYWLRTNEVTFKHNKNNYYLQIIRIPYHSFCSFCC